MRFPLILPLCDFLGEVLCSPEQKQNYKLKWCIPNVKNTTSTRSCRFESVFIFSVKLAHEPEPNTLKETKETIFRKSSAVQTVQAAVNTNFSRPTAALVGEWLTETGVSFQTHISLHLLPSPTPRDSAHSLHDSVSQKAPGFT